MTKETLTFERIQEELKQEKKQNKSLCFGAFAILVILILLTIWMMKLSGLFIVLTVFFGVWSLLFLLVVITLIRDVIKMRYILNQEICIVQDTLIGMEEKDDLGGFGATAFRNKKRCYLYFSQYGEYLVNMLENYEWSTLLGCMTGEGVYRSSHCGDEFYLVLSERNTGKILRVYNKNFFEFKD